MPIPGHGVVDARAGHDHGAEHREDAQGHGAAEEPADAGSEQGHCRSGADLEHALHLPGRQGIDVNGIEQQVNDA